ncbi:PIN/TRAM domain-containing protein [Cohnella lubricantis]|uniref:PIN/TRAM domain-containing protein n=1 Tax=Cohnella lubricantis TaxID=2163172 RepID=A0A841TJ54_9BACL|nr:PIN/TRAM domain-containing protein [Cohnella lubricantis]MBB6679268.1 PIN/TRAM domain-containing protein [Cohnella lubricantis]MBP2119598.1 uncharacterized protein YacL [Cohnella lubricantis]
MMMKRMIQISGLLIGTLIGQSVSSWRSAGGVSWTNPLLTAQGSGGASSGSYMGMAIGAMLGFLIATSFAGALSQGLQRGIDRLSALPISALACGLAGGLSGLAVAAFAYPYLSDIPRVGALIGALAALFLGYAGLRIGIGKQNEAAAAWIHSRRPAEPILEEEPKYEHHKILDTSVIIDGRIADICKTGFIEGTLVIPEFVLEELQHIADSSDLLKRNRGRRGLDILNKIQKELDVKVLIYEDAAEEAGEVDSRLVKLAKAMRGKVVTNDFNLNKVCELQGVSVLNINDLANAVKPVVLPGEEIVVQVIKDGKEHGQGVAYLDDGTMIVVEGGRDFIGTTMEVLVTSVLQTSAGRMIFAKPKLLEKAL